jgi:uncharacterized protein
MTTRRAFLASILAAGSLPAIGWAAAGNPAWIAAAKEADGSFALFGLDRQGAATFRVLLPARGHAGAGHPARAEAVAFARRPGAYALVIDCANGRVRHRLTPPEGRQFNGHGVFDPSGARLFTTEQDGETSEGAVGIWDATDGYRRIGSFPTGGIGPHDMRLMDGATLAIANGGIATDATDRTKLNLDTMQPNLAYLTLDGALLEKMTLAPRLHQASIRHLALGAGGLVAFAMQWEGPEEATVPLLGLHRRGADPVLAEAPEPEQRAMQGYAGSIAVAGNGREVAITSPRGGRVQRFDLDGAFLGATRRADVCGLAPCGAGFMASDGLGGLIGLDGGRARPLAVHAVAWDNHVVTLPG